MGYLGRLIISTVLAVFVTACASNDKRITISDYVVGADYEILEVDGTPAVRTEHGAFVTVVPLVLVTEGRHVLKVRYTKLNAFARVNSEPEEVVVFVEQGKEYRIMRQNGSPVLVEQNDN